MAGIPHPDIERIREILASYNEVTVAFVFGSLADGSAGVDSDADVAVFARKPLPTSAKARLLDELAIATARPVDLVDLSTAPPPMLRRAVTTGLLCKKSDVTSYADLLRKLWYDQADIMPNYNMVLRRRREAFIGG